MKKAIELDSSERSFVVNALASFVDVLESAQRVFPSNETVQEETTFKIKKAKELIGKFLTE